VPRLDWSLVWPMIWLHGTLTSHLVFDEAKRLHPLSKGSAARWAAVLAVVPIGFAPLLLRNEDRAMKGIVAMASCWYVIRSTQTFLEPRFDKEPLLYRCMHVGVTFHDLRTWKARGLPLEDCSQRSIYPLVEFLANVAVCVSIKEKVMDGKNSLIVKALGGGLYGLCSLYAFGAFVEVLSLVAAGIQVPRLMNFPLAATSLQDFWSRRWDTAVQEILGTYVYTPLRKKWDVSKPIAVLATFVMSGLIHVFPLYVNGMPMAVSISMFSYFIAQCGLLLAEQNLDVTNWKNMKLRRLWTLSMVALPLPLLVGPTLALSKTSV